jgi:predicted heme/steroid binding protein
MQVVDVNGNMFGYDHLEIIGADGRPKSIDKGLTSVGLSMPSAFTVSNSPLTSNGTIGVTGAGTTSQYIDGTGALRAFPGLTGYVPYVGATQNVDLGEFEIKAGQFTLDVSPTGTATVGTTRWNNTIGSSETTLKGGNVILKNGVDLVARVVNKVTPNTTLTKANYPAVRVSGAQGQRLAVAYAQANNDNNSADTIGLVVETIATNQEGFIMTVGQLNDVNTTGSLQGETWADGDVLYLSPTTPGALTNVKPTGLTGHIVVMGYVEYAHAIHGSIYVKIMNGWELDELHNVYINNPLNNQGLFYNASDQLWKNKSIDSALGYTPVPDSRRLTINGTVYDLTADRTWSVGTVTSVTASSPLSSSGGTTPNITISQASGTDNGYLSSTDWTTFNSKQPAGNYITSLSGEATGSGPGTAAVTLNNASVTAKVLTGVNITGGSINASDSILTAFGKLQNQINGLIGSSVYQGTWNASTNTPALASGVGTRGYYYIVNVAGSTNLDGITDWNVGDWAIFDGTAWQQVDNTDSVTSVNGQTGAVSLTTDNIPEGATNLYFTQLRARQSITLTTSGSSGASTYNNSTGALNIPNYTLSGLGGVPSSRRIEINGISYDLSADRSWSVGTVTSISTSGPLTGGTITGSGTIGITQATPFTDGYLSYFDWNTFNNKQNAITLTTTGTSGAATLIGSTLNIPQYQSVITNPVTGTGAANYVARWTSSSNIGTGVLYDNGTNVGINTTAPGKPLEVYGDVRFQSVNSRLDFTVAYNGLHDLPAGILLSTWSTANNNLGIIPSAQGTVGSKVVLGAYNGSVWRSMVEFANTSGEPNLLLVKSAGYVGIGTTSPAEKLDVVGNLRLQNSSLGATIYFGSGAGDYLGYYNSDSYYRTVGSHYFEGAGFYKGMWNSIGNLGIGTTAPQTKLTISGANVPYAGQLQIASNDYAQISFYNSGSLVPGASNRKASIIYNVPNSTFEISNQITSGHLILQGSDSGGGRVGIGTDNPSEKLSVNGNIALPKSGETFIFNDQSSSDSVSIGGASYVSFKTYSGGWFEKMRIATNGNVGIGTTNPTSKLTVAGSVDFESGKIFTISNGSGQSLDIWHNAGSGANYWRHIYGGTGTGFGVGVGGYGIYYSGNSNYSQINFPNGNVSFQYNVGIGTTAPINGSRLEVSGSGVWDGGVITLTNTGAGGKSWSLFSTNNSFGQGGGKLLLYNTTDGIDAFVVDSASNMGIGTTSPSQKLHVAGNLRVTGSIVDSNNSAGTSGQVLSSTGSGTDWVSLSEITGVDGTGTANYVAKWQDANTIQNSLIYDNGTSVGINTTSPTRTLDVIGDVRASSRFVGGSSGQGFEWANYTYGSYIDLDNGQNALRIRNSASTIMLEVNGSSNYFTGNLGLGTTNPKTKLDVNGTIGFGSKSISISDVFADALTVNMNDHTGCYVKITAFGDWGNHSTIAYVAEFFLQASGGGYNEPGLIIRQVDNTANDDIQAQILDPVGTGTRNFVIQLKSTSSSYTPFNAYIQYEVRGLYNSVS